MGGLATAALAQRRGLRVALLEAHTKLGGCAGYFDRGPYHLRRRGHRPDGPGPRRADRRPPGGDRRRLRGGPDPELSRPPARPDARHRRPTPGPSRPPRPPPSRAGTAARRLFWRLQAAVGTTLFRVANRRPPAAGPVARRPRARPPDPRASAGLLAASTWALTVLDVLRLLGLDDDVPFRSLVAMLLQDTAQAGPGDRPVRQRRGLPPGLSAGDEPARRAGWGPWPTGSADRFAALGGDLRTATLVDRVEPPTGGRVRRRRPGAGIGSRPGRSPSTSRSTSPRALLGRPLDGALGRREREVARRLERRHGLPGDRPRGPSPTTRRCSTRSCRTTTGRSTTATTSWSRSRPPSDPGYGPPDVRVATLSTHTRPGRLGRASTAEAHAARKADYRDRLLAALGRALPDAPDGPGPRRVRHAPELRPLHPADRRARSAARRSRGGTAPSSPSAPTSSAPASGSSATRSSPARGRWPPSSRRSGSSSGSPGIVGRIGAGGRGPTRSRSRPPGRPGDVGSTDGGFHGIRGSTRPRAFRHQVGGMNGSEPDRGSGGSGVGGTTWVIGSADARHF